MPATIESAAFWSNVLRKQSRRDFFKLAAPGDDAEMPFEQAMSNLSHATLRDKAPGLLEYELGFQLIEKSDDNDKAVGIFGFKVGPQLLYAPVFFLSGELKGSELLYLKASDTFVPMSEDWINYLLARKPQVIGDNMSRSDTSRAVKKPDLRVYTRSPARKYAAWVEDGAASVVAADYNKLPAFEPVLPGLIKQSSACALQLVHMWDAQPALLRTFRDHYGEDFVKMALERASDAYSAFRDDPPEPVKPQPLTGSIFKEAAFDPTWGGKLKIYTYDGTFHPELTTEELEKLAAENVLVKDEREETTKVYDGVEMTPMSMMTPNETGIYSVLLKPDKFERCLVVMSPRRAYGDPATICVKLDGDKTWIAAHATQMWAETQESTNDFRKWFNDQPEATSVEDGDTYVLLGPGGESLGPIDIRHKIDSGEGEAAYHVSFTSRGYLSPGFMLQTQRRGNETYSDQPDPDTISVGLIGGTKLVERSGIYYVPKSWKAIKLSNEGDRDFRVGNPIDVQLGIITKTAELKLWADGIEAELDGRRMAPMAAKMQLITRYNIREKVAEDMLKLAVRNRGYRFRLKQADSYDPYSEQSPYDQYGGGFNMPGFPEMPPIAEGTMGTNVQNVTPSQMSQEMDVPVPSTYPRDYRTMSDPPNPDPDMMNHIQQAAETGQKEVLDTSTLASMLKSQRSENLIDQYLGDLLKGLDRIGRLLFNFYWRSDIFAERYGDNEMKEIEDLLRSQFEGNGDLVLKLRQETIEPFPGESLNVGVGQEE